MTAWDTKRGTDFMDRVPGLLRDLGTAVVKQAAAAEQQKEQLQEITTALQDLTDAVKALVEVTKEQASDIVDLQNTIKWQPR